MAPTDQLGGLRKAALLLHSLPHAAREAAVSRLDPLRQAALAPLLDELQALGIPPGRAWVDLGQAATPSVHWQAVWALSPEAAAAALKGQSLETVAAVMSMTHWPWLDPVLADWAVAQQAQLKELLRQRAQTVPPLLAASLLEAFAAQAHVVRGQSPSMTGRSGSWFKRVFAVLAS